MRRLDGPAPADDCDDIILAEGCRSEVFGALEDGSSSSASVAGDGWDRALDAENWNELFLEGGWQ